MNDNNQINDLYEEEEKRPNPVYAVVRWIDACWPTNVDTATKIMNPLLRKWAARAAMPPWDELKDHQGRRGLSVLQSCYVEKQDRKSVV